jgi:hypothetical protein
LIIFFPKALFDKAFNQKNNKKSEHFNGCFGILFLWKI